MILYHTSTLEIRRPEFDQVFDTVDLYFSGIYTKEQALDQLRYKKPNHQVCITSQDVLDKYLHFQSSEIL